MTAPSASDLPMGYLAVVLVVVVVVVASQLFPEDHGHRVQLAVICPRQICEVSAKGRHVSVLVHLLIGISVSHAVP